MVSGRQLFVPYPSSPVGRAMRRRSTSMTSVPHSNRAELSEARDLMRGGNSDAAVEVLRKVVEQGADSGSYVHARFLVSGSRSNMTRHFATPRPRCESEPSSCAGQRSSLRKCNLALGITPPRCRITTLLPPSFANSVRHRPISIRFQHILPCTISNSSTTFSTRIAIGNRPPAPSLNNLHGLRPHLAGRIDGANGEAPWVSVNGRSS